MGRWRISMRNAGNVRVFLVTIVLFSFSFFFFFLVEHFTNMHVILV